MYTNNTISHGGNHMPGCLWGTHNNLLPHTAVVYRLGEGLLLAVRSAGNKIKKWPGVSVGHAPSVATVAAYRLPQEGVAVAAGGAVVQQKIYKLGGVDLYPRSILAVTDLRFRYMQLAIAQRGCTATGAWCYMLLELQGRFSKLLL